MAVFRQSLCLFLLGLWILLTSLFPNWNGKLYNPDNVDNPTSWRLGGSFGLADSPIAYVMAPVWAPPKPYSELINPTVRWPWQRPFALAHLEISMWRLVARWTFAVLFLGLIYLLLAWCWPSVKRDSLFPFMWTSTAMLFLAWGIIGVLTMLSMGYAATDEVILGILVCGWILGMVIGFIVHVYRSRPVRTPDASLV